MQEYFLEHLLTFKKYDEWVDINDPDEMKIHAWIILLRSLAYTKQMLNSDFKNRKYWKKYYKQVKTFLLEWNYKPIPDDFKQFL